MSQEMHDVAVIGGGVVGCAVARSLSRKGFRVVILEARPSLAASPATAGNTGIACTSEDTDENSLEYRLLKRAVDLNAEVYPTLNIPHRPSGTLYLAGSLSELKVLQDLLAARQHKGDQHSTMVPRERLSEFGVELPSTVGALFVPREVVVEPWLVPVAWAVNAIDNGTSVRLSSAVLAANPIFDVGNPALQRGWVLETSTGDVSARLVVNCGGLDADHVEAIVRPPNFQIKPRRGDFVVFERFPPNTLPIALGGCPSKTSRGLYIWQTIHGHIVCGPTALDQSPRTPSTPPPGTLAMLRQSAIQVLPWLTDAKVVGYYSGLRPATEHSDYQIEARDAWVTCAGIRSTGLTGSLAIAEHVTELVHKQITPSGQPSSVDHPLPSLGELRNMITTDPSSGHAIVSLRSVPFRVTHPIARFGLDVAKSGDGRAVSIKARL